MCKDENELGMNFAKMCDFYTTNSILAKRLQLLQTWDQLTLKILEAFEIYTEI